MAAFVFALVLLLLVSAAGVMLTGARADARRNSRQIGAARTTTEGLFAGLVADQGLSENQLLQRASDGGSGAWTHPAGVPRELAVLTRLEVMLSENRQVMADLRSVVAAAAAWRSLANGQVPARARAGGGELAAYTVEQHRRFEVLAGAVTVLQAHITAALVQARVVLDRQSARLTAVLYGSLALAGAMLGGLLLLVDQWIFRPLAKITMAVRAVSMVPETRIPAVGPAEIAGLGADVEAMRAAVVRQTRVALEANESLRQAEDHIRRLFDSVRDYAITRLDVNGVFTTWNEGAANLTGYAAADIIGTAARAFLDPVEGTQHVVETSLATAAAEGTFVSQRQIRRANGSSFLAHSVVTAIRNDSGEPQGFAVITRDVTQEDAARKELDAAHLELAARAAQLQQTNEATERANRELLVANRELEAFSYTVSHDLRAPLRAIRGFSDMLITQHRADLDEQATHYLDTIARNAERMSQLIDDLLAFARLRHSHVRKETTELTKVVDAAWEEVAPLRTGRDITLTVGTLPDTLADPRLLKQVFVNLFSNAIKFSADRPAAMISVRADRDGSGSEQPVISVRDNGIGFDPAHAARLFAVFQRLHGEHDYEGTGIGLSIVDRIVQRHGGRVWADAEPGQGATFFFTLSQAG